MRRHDDRTLLPAISYAVLLVLNVALTTASAPRPPTLSVNIAETAVDEPTFAAQFSDHSQPASSMSIWQFMNRIIRRVIAAKDGEVMSELETTVRAIVVALDKQLAVYGNDSVVHTTTGQRLVLDGDDDGDQYRPSSSSDSFYPDSRDTGDIFQHWLETNFNVAYQWTKNSQDEQHRAVAADFKAARDWVRDLAAFDHFTNEHVEIVVKFIKTTLPTHSETRNLTTSDVRSVFKQYLRDESASRNLNRVKREAADENDDDEFGVMLLDDEFRSVFMKHRNLTNWWDYILSALDYVEDAVVTYNRMQTMLWPPKMFLSFAWPPLKFIWTGIDIGACLFEEFYELIIALETEERWWDVLLCGMEVLGVIPGGGAVKFGLRIAIRLTKFITGIHTVPWYITMPWGWFSGWWWPNSRNVTTTLAATTTAVITTLVTTTTTTETPTTATEATTTQNPNSDPYNWARPTTTTQPPETLSTEESHEETTTRRPFDIIGGFAPENITENESHHGEPTTGGGRPFAIIGAISVTEELQPTTRKPFAIIGAISGSVER